MGAPARFDFAGEHAAAVGTTWSADIYLQDVDGDPISLAGKTPSMLVWKNPRDSSADLSCTTGNGRITVIDEFGGHLRVTMSATDVTTLGARAWVYALLLTTGSVVQGLLAGQFAEFLPSIPGIARSTTATANNAAYNWAHSGSQNLRDGSAAGDGYLYYALVRPGDASYGTGATGVSISAGPVVSGALPSSNARPGNRCTVLQYNTAQSDTNWQAIVNNGSNNVVDTGVAFIAQNAYLLLIYLPRSGSATYFHVTNLTTGASGSATVSATPGSTAMRYTTYHVTLDNVARSLTTAMFCAIPGGAL